MSWQFQLAEMRHSILAAIWLDSGRFNGRSSGRLKFWLLEWHGKYPLINHVARPGRLIIGKLLSSKFSVMTLSKIAAAG
jgi:hypothetical protein